MKKEYNLSGMRSRPNPYASRLKGETEGELGRVEARPKTGQERFHADGHPLEFNLLGFWQWSASDLVSNTMRGCLAEYIVAKALGLNTDGVRTEWDSYDLLTPSGVRIEVKSSGYLQSWEKKKPSAIRFSISETCAWDAATNLYCREQRRQADVYVFAIHVHLDKATVDPMNVDQWRFHVVPTALLNARTRNQKSISLEGLKALSDGAVNFDGLREAVLRASNREGTGGAP